ncbi:MAG: hypothetical protein ACTSU2_08705 [Promethearchaeota archaeon]
MEFNFDFSWVNTPIFMIVTMIYFSIFGLMNLYYAISTRNDPLKKDDKTYFVNEVITAGLYFLLVLVYPFLFDSVVPNDYIKHQIYFHMWDVVTIQIILWEIYSYFARRNNKKYNRNITYEEWRQQQIEQYNSFKSNSIKTQIKRKLQHILPGGVVLGFYGLAVVFQDIAQRINWDVWTTAYYFIASTGITWALMMNIFDIRRLMAWHTLGNFARKWANNSLKPHELYSTTSAAPMVYAFVPFFALPYPQVLFSITLISGLSDAMAGLIGKRFGKVRSKKPGSHKTAEGYVAGIITTYILVLLVNYIIPFPGINIMGVHIIAAVTAFSFFIVDKYLSKTITDNVLNPILCGLTILAVYLILIH